MAKIYEESDVLLLLDKALNIKDRNYKTTIILEQLDETISYNLEVIMKRLKGEARFDFYKKAMRLIVSGLKKQRVKVRETILRQEYKGLQEHRGLAFSSSLSIKSKELFFIKKSISVLAKFLKLGKKLFLSDKTLFVDFIESLPNHYNFYHKNEIALIGLLNYCKDCLKDCRELSFEDCELDNAFITDRELRYNLKEISPYILKLKEENKESLKSSYLKVDFDFDKEYEKLKTKKNRSLKEKSIDVLKFLSITPLLVVSCCFKIEGFFMKTKKHQEADIFDVDYYHYLLSVKGSSILHLRNLLDFKLEYPDAFNSKGQLLESEIFKLNYET